MIESQGWWSYGKHAYYFYWLIFWIVYPLISYLFLLLIWGIIKATMVASFLRALFVLPIK